MKRIDSKFQTDLPFDNNNTLITRDPGAQNFPCQRLAYGRILLKTRYDAHRKYADFFVTH